MREVSTAALQAMLAQDSAEVFIACLKISHPDLDADILLAYNTETVTRTAGDYLPFAFQINLPTQSDDEIQPLSVTIDNTSLEVNDKLRALTSPPTVVFDVVLASSPDTIEAGPFNLTLTNVDADANTIQGTLGYEQSIFDQQVPAQTYVPTSSPGLFT